MIKIKFESDEEDESESVKYARKLETSEVSLWEQLCNEDSFERI